MKYKNNQMRTNPLPRLGEGIYTPLRTGHVGFVGVQHSLGPFLGPISILRALALLYGTTDTLRVSYREVKGKILAIGQISPNSTNTFSAAGPSNDASSPTNGKSSCIDASQLPDDPDMPELEDITYSDDEDDAGAEADFNNLETSITVSPIPTTRVHKDHHVTQIIGDLSSATQTRSMTRVAKD
nr:hypothetical protein [Tanacetum cinerariifolium]